MVPGHYEYGNSLVCDSLEGDERALDETGRHSTAEKQVAAMNNKIDSLLHCCPQDQLEIGEEVVTPPAAVDPRSLGEIEAEMSVRQE